MNQRITRYTKTAIILHWLIGLLLLGMLALGFWMHDLPKEVKVEALDLFDLGFYTVMFSEPTSLRTFYFNLHKSIGVTLLVLIFVRLFWRLTHAAPEFPATMKAWEKRLSDTVHKAMYVLMVAMPISGVLMATYSKFGIKWFGIALIEGLDNPALRDAFKEAHEFIGLSLLALIVLHVIAAIKHKVVDKDEVMQRMSLHG
jgi:cytochrome b561